MRQLSTSGLECVHDIAQRHGFSFAGTLSMLDAVIDGNGSMAQFNHPDFGGSGQWMRGGMTMVSDMFNHQLKSRVVALCAELDDLVHQQPDLVRSGSFQSQRQSGGPHQVQEQAHHFGQAAAPASAGGTASLFAPRAPGDSGDWWPSDLRWPNSTGAQNGVRYAYFAQARRLVIDLAGTVTVYDTLDHQLGGFSQQQSVGGTLGFSSQYGLLDVTNLPVVSSNGRPPDQHVSIGGRSGDRSGQPTAGRGEPDPDVLATLERLADLRGKGIVSDAEFATKKAELLSRV